MNPVIPYLKILRPHQWAKNVFVLAGIIFSEQWDSPSNIKSAFLAFIGFCFVSSAVYVFNDIIDRKRDKLHPLKANRPIANGKVKLPSAVGIIAVFLVAGIWLGFYTEPKLALILALYLGLNVLYSLYLKNKPIADLFCIALGFLLRVLAGSWAIHILPSPWILLCTFMLSLFLGANKRYAELSHSKTGNREVLHFYSLDFLRSMIIMCGCSSLLTYGLYTLSPQTISVHGGDGLIYTVPVVAYGLLRYMYLVFEKKVGEDLAKDLFKDRTLLLVVLIYILMIWAVMGYQ